MQDWLDPGEEPRHFRIYGLCLGSSLIFPDLETTPAHAIDVSLRRGSVTTVPPAADSDAWYRVAPDDCVIHWPGLATVQVRGGREIVVEPEAAADLDRLRALLLGPVFGFILFQRGMLPIHASAASIAGRVIAIAAPSGLGKSTLAAALYARGHQVLADDLTAIALSDRGVQVVPAPPTLRLSDESAALLGLDTSSLPRAPGRMAKHILAVTGNGERVNGPLARILILTGEPLAHDQPLPKRDACFALMEQFHRLHMLQAAADPVGLMERCARVVEHVPVHRLAGWRAGRGPAELVARVEQLADA